MDAYTWVVLVFTVIYGGVAVWGLRRIKRGMAESAAQIEARQEARNEAIRTRSVYKMPFQNLKAKRDAEVRREAMPNIDWEEF
jgi:cbb3-type cytochrome oxidase subunit 3